MLSLLIRWAMHDNVWIQEPGLLISENSKIYQLYDHKVLKRDLRDYFMHIYAYLFHI